MHLLLKFVHQIISKLFEKTMVSTEFNLYAKNVNGDYSYAVNVAEGMQGLVRMVVTATNENNSKETLFQGLDLTVEECKVLGKYLLDISERERS